MKIHNKLMIGLSVILITNSFTLAGDSVKSVDSNIKDKAAEDWKKPAWLKDVSLNVKESFDSNIYYTEQGPLGNNEAWITTITPKVGVDLAPLISPNSETLKTFGLTYSPQIQIFDQAGDESNTNHKLATAIKGKVDWFSYDINNSFAYVDGSRNGLIYNSGRISAWTTTLVRARREQIQDEAKANFKFDLNESFFFRPTASLVYNDFMTVHKNTATNPGYQNYIDRSEVVGGADFGYNITKDFAATFGYRYGHQDQARLSWSSQTSSNDFQRVVAGVEGKPLKWLKLDLQAGPDFRDYTMDSPNYRKGFSRIFAQGSATAEITSKDKVRVGIKQFEWLSSTSAATYENKMYEIAYTRKITDEFTAEVGARSWELDYEANANRDDTMYTYYTTLTYAIDSHWTIEANYTFDRAENNTANNSANGGEFQHHIGTLGASYKF